MLSDQQEIPDEAPASKDHPGSRLVAPSKNHLADHPEAPTCSDHPPPGLQEVLMLADLREARAAVGLADKAIRTLETEDTDLLQGL